MQDLDPRELAVNQITILLHALIESEGDMLKGADELIDHELKDLEMMKWNCGINEVKRGGVHDFDS